MSDDTPRQHDATTADLSRPVGTGDDNEFLLTVEEARARGYTLSVEEALAHYVQAGLDRTPRSIQRYCSKGHLEAHRVEAEFGIIFLIKPESVEHHIAYIMQVRPVATGRDLSRQVATDQGTETKDELRAGEAEATDDKLRQVPTTVDVSQPVTAADQRYVAMLERENEFLHQQIKVKDEQIAGMAQHLDQSNALTGALHKLLAPLLGSGTADRIRTYVADAEDVGDNPPAT